jgi:hypothetical protein
LGWDDLLIGTMRGVLNQGVEPRRYAFGAAAALTTLDRSFLEGDTPAEATLSAIWRDVSPKPGEQEAVLSLVEDSRRRLRHWCQSGFQDLELL